MFTTSARFGPLTPELFTNDDRLMDCSCEACEPWRYDPASLGAENEWRRIVGKPSAEQVAALFHEAYERLAPTHGYETRRDSSVPWDDVPYANRQLMIATCRAVFGDLGLELS